jgi:ABC-2 type transport system permease protein
VSVLRAYPTLVRVGFAESVAYRAEMFVWMLTMTMPLVSLALWSAIAAAGPVGRFGPRDFTAYFLATLAIRQVTSSWIVWQLNFEIRTGALSRRLLKPIHPLIAYSAENLGALPLRAFMAVPIALIAFWVNDGSGAWRDPVTLGVWAASLVGAWLITFATMALIGTLAFYIESSTSIFEIWQMAFMLLSGYLLPLELFPGWVRSITNALPFRYMMAFPVETILGHLDRRAMLAELGIQWAFVAGMGAMALYGWRAGMRRFAAFGG